MNEIYNISHCGLVIMSIDKRAPEDVKLSERFLHRHGAEILAVWSKNTPACGVPGGFFYVSGWCRIVSPGLCLGELCFAEVQVLRVFVLLLCGMLLFGCVPRKVVHTEVAVQDHLGLGVTYERQGDWDSAMREYALASATDPRGSFYLGNLLFQRNELDRAEQEYRKAMQHMQSDSDLFNNLAWLLYTKQDNLEEAEELANVAVQLGGSERFSEYWDTLEQIRLLRKQRGEAG